MTESEIREQGLEWQNVHGAFCWHNLSKDFIRQLVATNKIFRKNLEVELLADIHGWSVHASYFYQNMGYYIQNGLALDKSLVHYIDKIYQMYRYQAEAEYNARRTNVVRFVDGCGRVLDEVVYGI